MCSYTEFHITDTIQNTLHYVNILSSKCSFSTITIHYVSLNRCGEGLQLLYNTPQVQAYLNCIPSKELNMDKLIYSEGQLCKVLSHTNTYFYDCYPLLQLKQGAVECKLVNVPTSMCFQKDSPNLKFYICDFNCNIHLCSSISFESNVMSYNAVMTQHNIMANKGDFVKVTAAEVNLLPSSVITVSLLQVSFGVLLALFKDIKTSTQLCVVRELKTNHNKWNTFIN